MELPTINPRFMIGERLRAKFNHTFVEETLKLNYDAITRIVGASLSFLGVQWDQDVELDQMAIVVDQHRFHGFVTVEESALAVKLLKIALKSGMTIGELISAYGQIMTSTASWVIKSERADKEASEDEDSEDSEDEDSEDED